ALIERAVLDTADSTPPAGSVTSVPRGRAAPSACADAARSGRGTGVTAATDDTGEAPCVSRVEGRGWPVGRAGDGPGAASDRVAARALVGATARIGSRA